MGNIYSAVLIFSYASLPLIFTLIKKRKVDIFTPEIYYPIIFSFLYGFGSIGIGNLFEREIPQSNFIYYWISLTSFFIGLYARGLLNLNISSIQYKSNTISPRHNKIHYITTALFTICFIFVFYFYSEVGYLLGVYDAENLRTEIVSKVGGGVFYMVKTLPILSVVLTFNYLSRCKQKQRYKVWYRNFYFLYLIPLITLIALSGVGYRYLIVLYLLTSIISYHYIISKSSIFTYIFFGPLLFSFITYLGVIRLFGSFDIDFFIIKSFIEIRNVSNSFDIVLSSFPNDFPLFNGKLLGSTFATIIPGITMPHMGAVLKDLLGYNYEGGGFTPSAIGGFYLDFGMAGIVIGFFCIGYLLKSLKLRVDSGAHFIEVIFYAYLVQYSIMTIRSGVLVEILPVWIFLVLKFIRYGSSAKY